MIATGLAIEGHIPERTQWERKNYFYPDLPKGYQISQYAIPLAADGRLAIETSDGPFTVNITRAHLEEDTAKLVHGDTVGADGRRTTLVDFNRSGAPLMEIVTEPEIRTAEQARRYAEELQLLMRAIGASDADMERGQMRVEANVSLRPRGEEAFGTRVEVKNMNSFRAVERAIAFEIERQGATLDAGETLVMETRGWDDGRQSTYRMRAKETSDDYRYFPEPDLPPLHVEAGLDRRRSGPTLPGAARRAAGALRGPGPHPLRRRGHRRRPGHDGRLRGDLGRRAGPAGEGGRELRVRCPTRRAAKATGLNEAGTAGASSPAGIAALLGGDRRGPGLPPVGARAARAPPRGRHARGRAARRRRPRPDLRRRGAARPRRRGHRRQPEGRRGLPRRQAGRSGSSSAR